VRYDDLLSPTRAAAHLGVGVSTLRAWAQRGLITRVMISGQPFYRRQDLDRFKRPKRGRPPRNP
jgi:DNA-binding transcriptional MerR regulator